MGSGKSGLRLKGQGDPGTWARNMGPAKTLSLRLRGGGGDSRDLSGQLKAS